MRLFTLLLILLLPILSFAQVNYTANNQITPYDGYYRAGVNPGYHGSNWSSQTLADISAGNPAAGTDGVGVRAIRGSLPEGIAEQYGYFIWTPIYDYYAAIGMKDNTVFVGFASDAHKDPTEYCPGIQTDMFANLYEPIWDNGENGTPINDNNYYAAYLYKVINAIGHEVRFWEIWNEPGFDYSGVHGWLAPGQPGNWWDNNPDPCDYKLRAPVFHFIRTMRISYEIIKTLSPEDYVVFSGVGYDSFLDVVLRNTDNPVDGSPNAQFPLGGGAYFDVLGFHAYPHFDGSTRYWSNDIGAFVYTRHSDAAVDGMLEKQERRQTILDAYGYDGVTFPEKMWTVTEVNIPRKGFSNQSFGSELVQVNYITKLVVESMKNNIVQTHIWDLGEEEYFADATGEFDLMGLYEKLNDEEPFTQVKTDEGIAYKTASDFLFGSEYDANKTAAMNLPSNVRGGAFQKENGDYIYALWAITSTDLSETANASYSFPSSFGINNLRKRNWNYSETNTETTVDELNVSLSGTPIFLVPNINATLGQLTLNCPDYEFEVGGTQQEGGAYVTWQNPTATTTCPGGGATVTLVSDIPNGGFFPFGMTVVHYEATDACGNKTQCAMAIKVASTGGGLGDCHLYRYGFNYRGQFRGNKYLVSLIDTTWAAAKEICASHGGHLVTISDWEENEFIRDAISGISDVVYIGLTDNQTEGQLKWEDNNPLTFTNYDNCSWCQPNSSALDYVEFHAWNGLWSFNNGQAEMFFVMELPCSEQTGCTDNDNDGVCAAEDCNDANPNLPATPGSSCNDNNANTTNDVIQSDGCTCQGTSNNDPCNITYTTTSNSITINGANAAHVKIRVFNSSWQEVASCFDNCNTPQIFSGLVAGDYKLNVLLMNSSWQTICQVTEDFTISGGGCVDNDNDGTCAPDDCNDNDPAIPATPGTSCNDNNANTTNDVIQSDGCTCQGTSNNVPCNITYTTTSNAITINGANAAHVKIRVFNSSWQEVASCFDNCNSPQIFSGLVAGDYKLNVLLMNSSWQTICQITEDFTISGGGCTDADNDGVCAPEDCNDNNPSVPTTPGSSCNDNNASTINDVIQSDGCTCAGVPPSTEPCGLNYAVSGNSLSFTFNSSPHYKIRLFSPSWQVIFECLDNCATPQVINNLAPGTYRLDVLLFNSNWTTTCATNQQIVIPSNSNNANANHSTTEEETEGKVTIYPNPSSGIIYVQSERGLGKSVTFEVYNTLGQKVKEEFVEELFLNPVRLDLTEEVNGYYVLVMRLEDGRRVARRFVLSD